MTEIGLGILIVALILIDLWRTQTMAANLDALTAAVNAQTTGINSAIALLQHLTALLASAGADQASIDALTKMVTDNNTALGNAVTAATPPATP